MTVPGHDEDKSGPATEVRALSPKLAWRHAGRKKKMMVLIAVGVLVIVGALAGGLAGGLTKKKRSSEITYEAHPDRAAAVQAVFRRAWAGYHEVAFPHDSLKPVSRTYVDDRNGWGATAIDALSTALIMGEHDIVAQILDFVPTIDFDKDGNLPVSVFETTIRYLGGLLSAHDLLTGPARAEFSDVSNATLQVLLDQATHVATNLRVAFDTPTGLPVGKLWFSPPRIPTNLTSNSLAGAGSLVLEWTRLSDKTGHREFAELAQAAEALLLDGPGAAAVEAELWPGMRGTNLDVRNASFVDAAGGWSGSSDSYYEYLLKMYLYDRDRFPRYRDEWIKAADSSIEFLASHPSSRSDLTFLATYDDRDHLTYQSGHLACFNGGNFILGGLTLSRPDYVDFGLELAASCHETYTATYTGLGPEAFAWAPAGAAGPPVEQLSTSRETGFWTTNGEYLLRPEALESWYHAWRATGDAKYQDWAWAAFKALNATCTAGEDGGLSGVRNVNVVGGGSFNDHQESFLFAETLKYAYLIQAGEAPWQISAARQNQFVFSTEAHLLAVAGPPS